MFLHGRAALVEYSINWLKIQPKSKIQNKNDVIIINKGKKIVCATIKSELIL